MREFVSTLLRKASFALASAVVVAGAFSGGVALINRPEPVAAAPACPQDAAPETNIVYCGLDGSTGGNAAGSLAYAWSHGDGHGHSAADIQTDLKAAGFTGSMFNSGVWRLGTAFDKTTSGTGKATLVVNGQIVGTDLRIAARCPDMNVNCSPASAYTKLVNDVFTRDANWFFDKDAAGNDIHSDPMVVHFDANGNADFALNTKCANMFLFKTVVTPKLSCKMLDANLVDQNEGSMSFDFTVTASDTSTPNFTFHIDFGDNTNDSQAVTGAANGDVTSQVFHKQFTRLDQDKTYTVSATVNSQAQVAACQKPVTIVAKKKLVFACQAIDLDVQNQNRGSRTIIFTAHTQGTDTAASYQFVFGDGSQATQTSNSITHTYSFDANVAHTFNGYFVATSTTLLKTDKSDNNCQFHFSTTPTLVRTGPGGTLAIVGTSSTLGVVLYQIILRRKLSV